MASSATTILQILSEPIEYRPGQPRDRETSRLIRSHVVEHTRRRKHRLLLNQPKGCEGSPQGTFCSCSVCKPSIDHVEAPAADPSSGALQKQCIIADTYKICQRCRRLQFMELSWLGKMKIVKARVPSIFPLKPNSTPFRACQSSHPPGFQVKAMSGCGESPLGMAIKAEALRQIKNRLKDPEKQNTTLTVASIGYLSSGVCIDALIFYFAVSLIYSGV